MLVVFVITYKNLHTKNTFENWDLRFASLKALKDLRLTCSYYYIYILSLPPMAFLRFEIQDGLVVTTATMTCLVTELIRPWLPYEHLY